METPTPQWRQYGQGGDVIGAKRMRWSFRFFVIATLLSTFSLWYVENFMRHDLRETQYISSLTLHFESARPILRNIIANEERDGGEVTPKYLLALAAVEEEDIVLPTYERAFALTPSDTNLLINYGVQLFMADRFLEARDRFREAGIQAPDNALPRYLEAAALTASSIEEGKDPLESGALVDALALIERTNNRNTPIVFPKPLWHPTLPTDNHWYQMKRREIVSNTCSPLYTLQTIVIPRAINEPEAGRTQNWDAWLETLQRMGARLVSPPNPGNEGSGVIRVQTGLKIQETAIRLRQRIHEMEGAPADESLADLAANIERAQEQLQAFEINREMAAKIHRSALTSPLKLAAFSMLIVTFAYIIAWILGWVVYKLNHELYAKPTDPAWTVSHSRPVLAMLVCVSVAMVAALFTLQQAAYSASLSPVGAGAGSLIFLLPTTGLGLLAIVATAFFGLLYPVYRLPSAAHVLAQADAELEAEGETPADDDHNRREMLRILRKMRRLAGVLLIRRYAGIHWGLTLVGICLWFLLFRLAYGVYPSDVALLTVSLREQELELIRAIQANLQ